jgi:hypothetical protein
MAARWTPQEVEKLRELCATGQSYRVIGAHLGRSADTVFHKAKALGLGPKPLTTERSITWLAIQRVCADGVARTVHELAAVTGASRHTIDLLLAHVKRWRTGHGAPAPYWLPVPGKSARRPKPLTRAEMSKRFRDRLRESDPIAYRVYLARNTARAALKAGKPKRQHDVVRALFGMGGTTS